MFTNSVIKIFDIFENSGFEIRIAGGAVRDHLFGIPPKDIDFATNALPTQIIEIAERNNINYVPVGLEHGTVAFIIEKSQYEITTLRKDLETDGRHAIVSFDASWEEDAFRRDLTINSLFMDRSGKIYDYVDGLKDFSDRIIKLTGNPTERIKEDYLRILRVFRFYSRYYNWNVDSATAIACAKYKNELKKISSERITSELMKILDGANNRAALDLMASLGVDNAIDLCYDNDLLDIINDDAHPIYKMYAFSIQKILFNKKINLSKEERRKLLNLLSVHSRANYNKKLSNYDINCMIHESKIIPKELKEAINSINYLLNYDALIDWSVSQKFPIDGNDIMQLGYNGIEIGNKLKTLKNLWIISNLSLTKEQLLKGFAY